MSNWWITNFPGGPGQPSAPAYGGGGADLSAARDPMDAKRMANGLAPGSSWPDGYLGTITDRREDKMLAVLQTRMGGNSYQRGVHKGEKVGDQAYFWNEDMSPDLGLARQSQVVVANVEGGAVYSTPRFAPTGDPVERLAHDGKTAMMDPRERDAELRRLGGDPAMNPPTVVDPSRRARAIAAGNLPTWSGVYQA